MDKNPFSNLPPTPAEHFKLMFYAAVLHVLRHAARAHESLDAMLTRFPFLAGYHNELAEHGLEGAPVDEAPHLWNGWLRSWESAATGHLPLRALGEAAGLDHDALTLLVCIGMIEEETRFGPLFEALQNTSGQRRPTLGLLSAWWPETPDHGGARALIRRFQELGLAKALNPDQPQPEWTFQVPGPLWEVLRGQVRESPAPWLRYLPAEKLASPDELVASEPLRAMLATLPSVLAAGDARTLIVRGPLHNGRKTALGSVARAMGRGLLTTNSLQKPEDERWSMIGPLAAALHAMPVVELDLAPGEIAELPALKGYTGPLGVILGRKGGVSGPAAEGALTLALDMPGPDERRQHWTEGARRRPLKDQESVTTRFRMTSGRIRQAARMAGSYAGLAGRSSIELSDIQQASRALNRQALETHAVPVDAVGDWGHLAVAPATEQELRNLEGRCRHREGMGSRVGAALGSQLNAGVRALFSGPSGTGKSLAARLLAASLQMDLYRVDLASVVNKYIGETEKNLNQVFSRAEELDVILLLDEGDALLTQRTAVQSATDRYANLETNFLLQRIESFEGILIVTTNAGSRIDSAFQRRMDVVVEFRPPEASERWAIWQLHLPAHHAVEYAFLRDAAGDCALSGAQIRNAVLHAALLAMQDGGVITTAFLASAVHREYRKMGSVCPLRPSVAVLSNGA